MFIGLPSASFTPVGIVKKFEDCAFFSKTVATGQVWVAPSLSLLTINLSPSSTFPALSPSNK